jgi:hypothetical protein
MYAVQTSAQKSFLKAPTVCGLFSDAACLRSFLRHRFMSQLWRQAYITTPYSVDERVDLIVADSPYTIFPKLTQIMSYAPSTEVPHSIGAEVAGSGSLRLGSSFGPDLIHTTSFATQNDETALLAVKSASLSFSVSEL